MSKIQINLVSRIASDKDSFHILIQLAEKLMEEGINDFEVLFIGAISDETILYQIIKLAKELGVDQKIRFTKKSIPIDQLDSVTKNGYFFNFTVGSFLGYSAMDAIQLNLKSILYNIDNSFSLNKKKYINSFENVYEIVEFIKLINLNKNKVDQEIYSNNEKIRKAFSLTSKEEDILLSLIIPKK